MPIIISTYRPFVITIDTYYDAVIADGPIVYWRLGDVPTGTPTLASTSDDNTSLLSSYEAAPTGIQFSHDGTKIFLIGTVANGIQRYSCPTPWDIGSIVDRDQAVPLSGVSGANTSDGIWISTNAGDEGLHMFVIGSAADDIHHITLGTAYSLGTETLTGTFDCSAVASSPKAVFVKPGIDRMYVLSGTTAYQYDINTPYDVTSSVYNSISFNFTTQDTSPNGIHLSEDGTKLFMIGSATNSVYQYTMSTPWDISSGSISYDNISYDVSGKDASALDVTISLDGSKMLTLGGINDTVYQFTLHDYSVPVDEIGTLTLNPSFGGDATQNVTGLINDVDTAVDFGGTGYIRQSGGVMPLGSGTEYVNGSFSIECWVDISSFPGTGTGNVIYEQRSTTGSHKNISLSIQNDGVIQQDKYLPSNLAFVAATPLVAGMKYHIVYTEDGTNRNLYIDGVLNKTDAGVETFSGDPITVWAIGASAVSLGAIMKGVMDELAIYRHELSAAQVLNHYTLGRNSYYNEVILDNPIVYYRMNETGATEPVDQIGTLTLDPTYFGTVGKGVDGLIANDVDTAVDFAGTGFIKQVLGGSGEFPLGAGVEFVNGSFSVECWVKMTTLSAGYSRIFVQRSSDAAYANLVLSVTPTGQLTSDKYLPSGLGFSTGVALSAGVRHHIVYTEDGVNRSFYVDGVLFATDANRETYTVSANMSHWAIGGEPVSDDIFQDGIMDEFAIYRHELSPTRILAHYNTGI